MPAWPTPKECRELLKRAGCSQPVIRHTAAVSHVAEPIAKALAGNGQAIDVSLVVAGAHLHDIGRSLTHRIDHANVGAGILRSWGLPEPLCLVVERHTGGGIDESEARALGIPPKDYTPKTLEEKVVCQADNLIDGERRQKVQEELDHLRGRDLPHVAAKIERLHRELSQLAGRDLDDLT